MCHWSVYNSCIYSLITLFILHPVIHRIYVLFAELYTACRVAYWMPSACDQMLCQALPCAAYNLVGISLYSLLVHIFTVLVQLSMCYNLKANHKNLIKPFSFLCCQYACPWELCFLGAPLWNWLHELIPCTIRVNLLYILICSNLKIHLWDFCLLLYYILH